MKLFTRYRQYIAVGLLLCSVVPTFGKETPQQIAGQKEIAATYLKINRAAESKNLKDFANYFAPDFKAHRRNGAVFDRQQYITIQSYGFNTASLLVVSTKIQKVQWRGPEAIVWVAEQTSYKLNGTPIVIQSTARDFWSKSAKEWIIRQNVELSNSTTIAGRKSQ